MNEKRTSWNKVATWYDTLLSLDDTYQKEVILPNLLRILDPKPGVKIIDIACGQGYFAKNFANLGAEIVGVDISSNLIKFAQKDANKNEKYYVSSADKLSKEIPSNYFDKAVIVLALQNIENIAGALAEASRVLKTGGNLCLVLNHPAFRIPKQSSWGYDEVAQVQYRRVDAYLSEAKIEIEMHPGQEKSESTISFHRPLQLYFKNLAKNKFVITRLEEWTSHKKSTKGPRQKAEDKSRHEIPLFMMIEAKKE
ncbi:MAG: methyltransferase domain-containing protein [Minisyncoccia bacterium]